MDGNNIQSELIKACVSSLEGGTLHQGIRVTKWAPCFDLKT